MTHFEILEKLDPDIIAHFIETGKSDAIPRDTQLWIDQVTMAYEIYEGTSDVPAERNISRAAKELQVRILAKHKVRLGVRTCQDRIYAALRYFHVDSTVPDKIWQSDFANKYEDLARKCEETEDFKTALNARIEAQKSREKASEAASLESDFVPVFLLSPDIDIINDLGFESKSKKEIARKWNDGYYLKMINGLPTDEENKKRLRIDANLPETPYEELESD